MMLTKRLTPALAVFTALAVACGGTLTIGEESSQEVPTVAEEPILDSASAASLPPVGTLPEGPSALRVFDRAEFPPPRVDTSLIISGGPPPDGIPPLDRPQFLPVFDNLELLDPAESVVALEIDGDARAYPVQVLIWHEIVNDVVGGVPVAVTYCPLCNSAATYIREINGVETTFGTSGLLFLSALVMYDRATESLWTHFDGRAVVGMLAGAALEQIASPLLSWDDFRSTYPDGIVLDPSETGYSRAYGTNPYVGYDDPNSSPFLFRGLSDTRTVAKERIVGVSIDDDTKAYTLTLISGGDSNATHDTVGGIPIAIFWKAGQASALDDTRIADGRDVGSVGVFRSEVDGQVLTFTGVGDRFEDLETGSTWLITGEAVAGTLSGTQLVRLPHLDTFWFAWATYRPETVLVTELPPS